jgi:hypothetical protein
LRRGDQIGRASIFSRQAVIERAASSGTGSEPSLHNQNHIESKNGGGGDDRRDAVLHRGLKLICTRF